MHVEKEELKGISTIAVYAHAPTPNYTVILTSLLTRMYVCTYTFVMESDIFTMQQASTSHAVRFFHI